MLILEQKEDKIHPRRRVRRKTFDDSTVNPLRLSSPTSAFMRQRGIEPRSRIAGGQSRRDPKHLKRIAVPTLIEGRRPLRYEDLPRRIRLIIGPLYRPGSPEVFEIAPGRSACGFDVQSPLVRSLRVSALSQILERGAQVSPRPGVIGSRLQESLKDLRSATVLTRYSERDALAEVGRGLGRVHKRAGTEHGDCEADVYEGRSIHTSRMRKMLQ